MYDVRVSKRQNALEGSGASGKGKEDGSGIYKCKYNGKRSGQSAWAVGNRLKIINVIYKCNL